MKKKVEKNCKVKPTPPPGRKMSREEAQDYVFRKYRKVFELLAKDD